MAADSKPKTLPKIQLLNYGQKIPRNANKPTAQLSTKDRTKTASEIEEHNQWRRIWGAMAEAYYTEGEGLLRDDEQETWRRRHAASLRRRRRRPQRDDPP